MDGTVERLDEGFVLRFERRLPHPPATVWDGLTQGPRISEWLGGPGSEIDLRVGGRHRGRSDEGDGGRRVAAAPPRAGSFDIRIR